MLESLKEGFLTTYPEFTPIFEDNSELFGIVANKIICLFKEYRNLKRCERFFTLYMLIAHYIVMGGYAKSVGILPQNGLISNSSVGDVTVGFEASPYNKQGFSAWLALTPYGREYLAWRAMQSGVLYVN